MGSEGFTLRSFKDFLKTTTPNCKYHKQILDYLKESDLSFHTFTPRHTLPIVAYIRYLQHSTSLEDIETSLTELGFSIRSVSNVINRTNKQPMSLFTIELDNNKSPQSSNTTHIRKTPPKAPSNEAKEVNAQPRPKRYTEAVVSDNSPLDIVSIGSLHLTKLVKFVPPYDLTSVSWPMVHSKEL
ncbi:hypothetical protein ACI65C_003617 [Semiaphis heraclei]